MILGVTPDDTGLVPNGDFRRLKEFGEEINERFEKAIGQTHGTGKAFNIKFDKVQRVNQIVIGEAIESGERIRKYKVEALINKKWEVVCSGTSVGNKRIQTFTQVNTNQLRLIIEKSIDKSLISLFKAYNVAHEESVRN